MVTNFVQKLHALLHDAITAIGYDFWGMEFIPQHRGALIRIYIDHAAGITIADCVAATHQIRGMLQVAEADDDFLPEDGSEESAAQNVKKKLGQYELEVSSPGIERPLFAVEQFARFVNHQAHIKFKEPQELMTGDNLEYRRQLTGLITAVDGSLISIQEGEYTYTIDHKYIKKAHLVM